MTKLLDIQLNSASNPDKLRRTGAAIMVVALINLVASLMMAVVLGPATIAGGDIATRTAYIVSHRSAVQLGWASWICASLSLVYFFHVLSEVLDARFVSALRFALILSIVGAASDTLADLMTLGIMPDIAERYLKASGPAKIALAEQFRTWDRFSVLCTGGLGNTCYGLAGCVLTYVIFRAGELNALLRLIAFPLWGLTFLMSYGSFALSSAVLPFAVGSTMATFVVWAFFMGLCFYFAGRSEGRA